ncbi:hypothetical protein [Mesorhizobium sp.]|uniref:hypothetical protein n=1 Tax=Mesorhizobium sp. TaxID=1871066 RepID=UPI0012272C28|nr:hypothetical protein [Mesorhizobium sp.]TIL36234.1 MAG: hypothetical protein E5Y85_00985 [Mesorhizobium sp.]
MTVDWTINLTGFITIAMLLAGGVVAWVTLRWRVTALENSLPDAKKAIEIDRNAAALNGAAVNASLKIMQERIEDIRAKSAHELAEFKLEVAKNYAGYAALRDMEARLVKAIDELGERLEKLSEDRPRSRP